MAIWFWFSALHCTALHCTWTWTYTCSMHRACWYQWAMLRLLFFSLCIYFYFLNWLSHMHVYITHVKNQKNKQATLRNSSSSLTFNCTEVRIAWKLRVCVCMHRLLYYWINVIALCKKKTILSSCAHTGRSVGRSIDQFTLIFTRINRVNAFNVISIFLFNSFPLLLPTIPLKIERRMLSY